MEDIKEYKQTQKVIIFFLDIIIYHISFVISFLSRYDFNLSVFNYRIYQNVFPYIMVIFGALNILTGMYVLYNKKKIDLLYSTVINQTLMMIVVTSLIFFSHSLAFPRSVIMLSALISMILLSISRVLLYNLNIKINGHKKVMVVGNPLNCKRVVRNFEEAHNDVYKVTNLVHNNYYEYVENNMENVDLVYLTENVPTKESNKILSLLTQNKKQVFLSSQFENLAILNADIMNIEDETFLKLTEFAISPELSFIKYIIDFIIAVMLLIITSPILLITAVLVKITSPGPVFYKQTRITKGQKEFDILKFRTMSETAEKDTGPVLATANDARVTSLGRYLRSLRIDELPQLFNVVKGDMSLVGPRPERPHFVNQFKEENQYYYLRHNVRAGITGYAQVNGKYATDFKSKLNFDLLYIKKYSLILDVQILLQTIKTVFDKVSSKGLEEDMKLEDYKLPEDIEIFD
ncbi:MAG: sugar transferase [Staphylococcus equorum]|nr:sugar transferase [Staphylococcus equorum]